MKLEIIMQNYKYINIIMICRFYFYVAKQNITGAPFQFFILFSKPSSSSWKNYHNYNHILIRFTSIIYEDLTVKCNRNNNNNMLTA